MHDKKFNVRRHRGGRGELDGEGRVRRVGRGGWVTGRKPVMEKEERAGGDERGESARGS